MRRASLALALGLLVLTSAAQAAGPVEGPYHRVEVVDGDTVVMGLTAGFVTGIKIRLLDINAPDSRGAICAEERTKAALATARMKELTARGVRIASGLEVDAFGRFLARLYDRAGRDLGAVLVAEGLAVPLANGVRRQPWCPAPVPPAPAPTPGG